LVLTYGPASASSRAGAWTGRRSCCAMVGSKGCSWRRRRPVGAEGAGVSGWKSGGELDGVSGEVSVWSSEADGPVGPGGGAASGAGGGGGGGRTLARVAAVRCMGVTFLSLVTPVWRAARECAIRSIPIGKLPSWERSQQPFG
jgi:hypothetical protein